MRAQIHEGRRRAQALNEVHAAAAAAAAIVVVAHATALIVTTLAMLASAAAAPVDASPVAEDLSKAEEGRQVQRPAAARGDQGVYARGRHHRVSQ